MAHAYDEPVRITDANRLYLYQLLGERLGIGRQTFMPRAQEVLEQAGLAAESLGYADTRSMLEAVGAPFEITTFKGGRHYVTVTRDESFDAALAKASDGKAAKGSKGRPWKRKKSSLKPVRPKASEERRPEPAADDATEKGSGVAVVEPTKDARSADAQATGETRAAAGGEQAVEASAETKARQAEEQAEPVAVETAEPVAVEAAEPVAAETVETEEGPTAEEPEASETAVGTKQAAEEGGPAGRQVSAATDDGPLPILEQIAEQSRLMGLDEVPSEQAEDVSGPATTTAPAPEAAAPAPTAPAAAEPEPVAPTPHPQPTLPAEWPHRLAREASMRTPVMALLTRLLPFDVDPMAVLDEDWRVARATGTARGNRSRVTFPLRYLSEGDTPVEVTIRRQARPGDARHWAVTLVDGDDGTGEAHEAAGIEGLPVADAGSWTDLAPRAADAADPARDLTQLVVIGTWDAALGALARAAAPERWNFPGEGAGKASRYGILREYLTLTLARVRAQGRLREAADGSLAAFDTGLVTPALEPLYAVMEPSGVEDIPWRLAGFSPAGTGELGERLSATLGEPPERATYLDSIDDLVIRDGALVVPDYREILGAGLARLPKGLLADELRGTGAADALERALDATGAGRDAALLALSRAIADEPSAYRRLCRDLDDAIDLALRRARLSWRELAPAWDPAENRIVLLARLCLVDDGRADCAIALSLQPSGAYRAGSVVSLPRAYSLARAVCRETPSWLSADVALA